MTTADSLVAFKQAQKQSWPQFLPLETFTTPPAARLVGFAGVKSGQRVLDVACGTGVVAVTAARLGASVTGLDLTPELLERARENASIAGVSIDWHEGDVEALPFEDRRFDVVLSQFGHIFAPRPDVALAEMLRVLEPGGTIAFSTWPAELMMGRTQALAGRYQPAPPDVPPPTLWGDPNVVLQRLGSAVRDVVFQRDFMEAPALSPQHYRANAERTSAPAQKLIQKLSASDPAELERWRREYEAIVAQYLDRNVVRHGFLMTRAITQ